MTARRLPGPLGAIHGEVFVPASKSLTNRALIAAAGAGGGRIERPLDCEDTSLLADALRQAGWPVDWDDHIEVRARTPVPAATVFLGNSGTGARLVLGLLACVPGRFLLDGSDRLRERPMRPLIEALESLGSTIRSRDGFLPVVVEGRRLVGGEVSIRPEVSSQFVSSLLLAAPLMDRGIDLEVIGAVPSRPYLDLTQEVLTAFGATVETVPNGRWRVEAGGLRPTTFSVEGDWSAVAFVAAAVAVAGGSVTVGPLKENSLQGDRAICGILRRAGLELVFRGERLVISGGNLRRFEADLTDTPDLFPALSVVAAAAPAGSVLSGLGHLKHKESDRLSVMVDNLQRLGSSFDISDSKIEVTAGYRPSATVAPEVTAAGDHRIAMAMAVAALGAGELLLDDEDCVSKSFPGFWRMWGTLTEGAESPP